MMGEKQTGMRQRSAKGFSAEPKRISGDRVREKTLKDKQKEQNETIRSERARGNGGQSGPPNGGHSGLPDSSKTQKKKSKHEDKQNGSMRVPEKRGRTQWST